MVQLEITRKEIEYEQWIDDETEEEEEFEW